MKIDAEFSFNDSIYLSRIHANFIMRDDKIEIFNLSFMKFAFFELKMQIILSEKLKNCAYMFLVLLES